MKIFLKKIMPNFIFAFVKTFSTLINFNHHYGIFNSIYNSKPINSINKPVPWITFPAIDYLSKFDFSDKTIFEFGSGQSTLFWAERFSEVISVESDKEWYSYVKKSLPNNSNVVYQPSLNEYASSIIKTNKQFDVILIDGDCRDECVFSSLHCLKDNGMLILDNSEHYSDITKFLREKGFFQIDFVGYSPLNRFVSVTSVFIRLTNKIQLNFSDSKPAGGFPIQ